eukprot:CAMPEP_0198737106 /NCGR_PEP_ID=MMETSP1475-20131203/67699_1 /TAXON_ID= ORGANISM="Unidentified sp., Strain CCMP1999" /NCGR_SAMPLE_ID=MMETSP1475 /ASSEMBLY_ACC=CAM_ASM_001111 /LENGTH=1396 /DNA_ID=CAMNT_0044500963 /DNA_START=56 /DNA_END=4246 /DNA_ORIENTATION=-
MGGHLKLCVLVLAAAAATAAAQSPEDSESPTPAKPTPTPPYRFLFLPEGRTCGGGSFIIDRGEPYGLKEELAMTFGWRVAEKPFEPTSATVTYRPMKKSCVDLGHASMQPGDQKGGDPQQTDILWQLDGLPKDVYEISVLVGDAAAANSTHVIEANGVRVLGPAIQSEPGERIAARRVLRVNSGSLQIRSRGGTNTKLRRLVITPTSAEETKLRVGLVPDDLRVDFRPESAQSCGARYVEDFGKAFRLSSLGFQYGWTDDTGKPKDATSLAVKRDDGGGCVFSSHIKMQPDVRGSLQWRVFPLENGPYRIMVKCGDPVAVNSTHLIEANGERILGPRVPKFKGEQIIGTRIVSVTNRIIVLSAANGGLNTKIVSLRIERLGATPTPSAVEATPEPTTAPAECVPYPSEFDGALISLLDCEQVLRKATFRLQFKGERAGVTDKNGKSTEFTMFLPATERGSYFRTNNLEVVNGKGLKITTSEGTMWRKLNNHQNALGIGLDVPRQQLTVTVVFKLPNNLQGKGEQACAWFGNSAAKFVWICVISRPDNKYEVEAAVENNDRTQNRKMKSVKIGSQREFLARMKLDPSESQVKLAYRGSGDDIEEIMDTSVPREFFSFDAANQDFRLGTRSFGGVWAGHGNGKEVDFMLTRYDVISTGEEAIVENTKGVDFSTSFISNVKFPTAMVYGPDERLYIANADCEITAIRFKADGISVANRFKYKPLGLRLCLGIDVDPDATSSNIILWVSHSDNSQNNGDANSGAVSRLSGRNFDKVDDVITGLPRAIANHAPNQLHFGPDRRLYLVIGSNTGSGAPNPESPTFGFRPEQCLSAALVVADVKKPGFRGNCTPSQNPKKMDRTGIASEDCKNLCDVEVFASGLRNSYDFTWRKGKIYATDNGIGGSGTAPNIPSDFKEGDSCNKPVKASNIPSQDTGAREDLLHLVEEGRYYGHPNPSRRECVFYAGNSKCDKYTVPRLPITEKTTYSMCSDVYPKNSREARSNYQKPVLSFGLSKSANGIITYKGDAFCGQMKNDLLVTWYSQEDQIRWLHFNDDGEVTRDEALRRSAARSGAEMGPMRNPIALAQNNAGDIFAAEFFGGRIRVFRPKGSKCSRRSLVPVPVDGLTGVSAASIGPRIFMFGGVSAADVGENSQHVERKAYMYDARYEEWTPIADLPFPLHSASAVNWDDENIFVFGGSTGDGPNDRLLVVRDHKFHDASNLPTVRVGAVAVAMERGVLWAGGQNCEGCPAKQTAHLYDPKHSLWSEVAHMIVPRAHAAAAEIAGSVYVCGGVGKSEVALSSCEVYDGKAWTMLPSMPVELTHAGAVAVNEKIVVKGGTLKTGKISNKIYEYDPSARTWSTIGEMQVGRAGAVVVRIDGMGIFSMAGQKDLDSAPHAEIFEY